MLNYSIVYYMYYINFLKINILNLLIYLFIKNFIVFNNQKFLIFIISIYI